MKKIAIGVVLFLSSALSFGQTNFGDYDCGQWFVKREPAKGWLLGFLSGINYIITDRAAKYDPLSKLNSAEQAFLWVDNYCKAHPLEKLSDAGLALYLELQKK